MAQLINTSLYNDANLKEYYQLEGLTGKNGNTLTNNGSVTFTAAKYNNGANFGTANSTKSLDVASKLSYAGGAYSIVLWAQITTEIAASNYDFVMVQDSVTDTQLYIVYQYNAGTRSLVFVRNKFGSTTDFVPYVVTLGTSNFYHLALTYDATTIIGYVNGVNIGNSAASGSGTVNIVDRVRIGAADDGSGGATLFASAIIDDVAFFNRELTAAEIATLVSGGAFFALV